MHRPHHRVLSLLLVSSLALGTVACSDDSSGDDAAAKRTTTTTTPAGSGSSASPIPASDFIDELAANLPGNEQGAGVVAACTTVSGLASRVAAGLSTEDDVKPQVQTLADKVRPIASQVADGIEKATVAQAREWCVQHGFAN